MEHSLDEGARAEAEPPGQGVVSDAEDGPPRPGGSERTFELVPRPPPAGFSALATLRPRVVGPGRRERAYIARAADLEHACDAARADLARKSSELALAALCERGAQRAADRLERELGALHDEVARLAAGERRLLVALGALQRENELLRRHLGRALGPRALESLPERITAPAAPRSALRTPRRPDRGATGTGAPPPRA